MKRIFFLIAIVLIFSGCSDKSGFIVDGTIKNVKQHYIYLSRLEVDTPILIDSAKISKSGSFHFKMKSEEADFFQIGLSKSNFMTLLIQPGEKIKLGFNSPNLFERYSVSGSEGSSKLQILDNSLAETKVKLDSINTLYNKVSTDEGSDATRAQLQAEYTRIVKAQRKKNIEFVITNTTSLAAIKALYQRFDPDTYVLYDPHDLQYLKIVTDSLTKYYPNSKQVKALATDFEKEFKQMNSSRIQKMAENMPLTKLNPDLKNTEGKRIELSSLKGKYVLLTFWSFKSQECVAENLQLKELYKVYNKKGFEIYQINLDQSEADWLKAVKFDELPWINTREDNPANPKNAILYNVKSLPSNALYNKENVIIATDIHGRQLKLMLDQLFK